MWLPPSYVRTSPLSSPLALLSEHEHHWNEDVHEDDVVNAAKEVVYPAEFRFREEMNLLSRQWKSILGALFILVYLVLMVFLNLAYYRYVPPESGHRLKDVGFELLPELSEDYHHLVDLPLTLMRGRRLSGNEDSVPYIVNIVRRFGLAFAAGHTLRAVTYLSTTIPGGNSKCLRQETMTRQPTLAQCFYRTASVDSNCGDLMFSGHILLCTLLLCVANRYASATMGLGDWQKKLYLSVGTLLTVAQFVLIVASRHHYTADCLVAFYFTPALWFSTEYYNPHDQIPDRLHIARAILDKARVRIVPRNSMEIA